MKLDKLIKNLTEIYEIHGNLEVIYAIDDEGNGYDPVGYDPSIGFYSNREFNFLNEDDFESEEEFKSEINAVCIN